jgi:hypothetical protein
VERARAFYPRPVVGEPGESVIEITDLDDRRLDQ